jgi:hypothetical protein
MEPMQRRPLGPPSLITRDTLLRVIDRLMGRKLETFATLGPLELDAVDLGKLQIVADHKGNVAINRGSLH